jgi:hypothetical protein
VPQIKRKSYPFYLVVKLLIEVDCTDTDQDPDDVVHEIGDTVASELDYNITFDDKVEAGDSTANAVEVPVKIVNTEVIGLLDEDWGRKVNELLGYRT